MIELDAIDTHLTAIHLAYVEDGICESASHEFIWYGTDAATVRSKVVVKRRGIMGWLFGGRQENIIDIRFWETEDAVYLEMEPQQSWRCPDIASACKLAGNRIAVRLSQET